MDGAFDPNAPDCSNGDFFCKLCLASMNSDQTWASHIVGRRHIKNVQKYPNGLPNRFENEESYDGTENDESYDKDGDYPPGYDDYYYGQDYYDRNPLDYVPAVRPNVVIDYGHSKKLDEILPAPATDYSSGKEQSSKVEPQVGNIANVDEILNEIKSKTLKNGQESKKDNFFEKINQRELARDLALELSKNRFYNNDVKADLTDKSQKPGESSKRKQDDKHEDEKRSKQRSSPDLIDMIHKYNDNKIFKGSKIRCDKDSSSTKLEVKLKKLDPDKLTPDVLDDLLSLRLKPKTDSSSKTTIKNIEKKTEIKVNLDDPEVVAEKLQNLPNKTFFKIVHNKLKNIELKDSEEVKMLLKLVSEAQEVVTKKLPLHVQSAAKAKMYENSEKKIDTSASPSRTIASVASQSSSTGVTNSVPSTSSQTQDAVVSQNYNAPLVSSHVQNTAGLTNYPAIPTVPQFPNPASIPVSSSLPGSIPSTSSLISSTQTLPAGFPGVPPRLSAPPNSAVYPSLYQFQNYQANSAAMYYQMMQGMLQNRQSVRTTNANTVRSTLPSPSSAPTTAPTLNLQPPRSFPPDLASAKKLEATLKQLQTLAEEYRSKTQPNEEPKKNLMKDLKKNIGNNIVQTLMIDIEKTLRVHPPEETDDNVNDFYLC